MTETAADRDARSRSTKWLYVAGVLMVLLLIATIPFARAKSRWGYGPGDALGWIIAGMPNDPFPIGFTEQQFDLIVNGMSFDQVCDVFALDAEATRALLPEDASSGPHYVDNRIGFEMVLGRDDSLFWRLTWGEVRIGHSIAFGHVREIDFGQKGVVKGTHRYFVAID